MSQISESLRIQIKRSPVSTSRFDNQTDEQLMKLYQNGEDSAFRVLYERHSSKVYGFLSKRIRDKEKVAEIYQDVFIKLHKSKDLYKSSLPLLPWMFTVTRSVMLDELRKNKNIEIVNIDDVENLLVADITNDSGSDLLDLLQNLPEPQRQALEMRYVKDNTFEEIAESLNIKPINARQVISRGLKKLRELIGEGGKS